MDVKNIIRYSKGVAGLYITKQEGRGYVSSILYYDKNGSGAKGEMVILDCKLQSFYADTEQEAQELAEEWFKKNIDSNFRIEKATAIF